MDLKSNNSILRPYRVLDLTEGGFMIGGRILADLGADVIKIENPGGSVSRIGPFYRNIPDPEKSLYWFSYNLNKRGITLDITRTKGQEIFKSLIKNTDVVMESFHPGYLKNLGLNYENLVKIKPDIILTSISAYGQNGPKSAYQSCDLIEWASGGYFYICGDPDRSPVWISFPQAALHGGSEAASGTMAALWHRLKTGIGQQVDVSTQECVVNCSFNAPEMWDVNKVEFKRLSKGINIGVSGVLLKMVWECKDGYTIFIAQGGVQPFVNSMKELVNWMAVERQAEEWLQKVDWAIDYDASKLTQQIVDRVQTAFAKFFLTKTKEELYEQGALKRRILLGPLSTVKDISLNKQLAARDFWVNVEHPELNSVIQYPGQFVKISENPIQFRHRGPLIGEHNLEIYEKELGLSKTELLTLKETGII